MKRPPTQLVVGLGILLIGGAIIGGEYFLVNWYPKHNDAVQKAILALVPYENRDLGFSLQVAAGLNEKVETFPGGVKISAKRLFGTAPSLTITSQPNPDKTGEFTPQQIATWETDGVQHNLSRYQFERPRINERDAVLIWQYKNKAMVLTARVIAPDHLIEASCTPGSADETLYLHACDESVRTIKVEGAPSPTAAPLGGMEILPNLSPTRR